MRYIRYNLQESGPYGLPLRKTNWLPAVIAAVGAVGAGLISASSSKKSADTSLQAQRETNETNIQLASENRSWQERMINQQNEYNSPESQMERYREAGINPYMAMAEGNVSSGAQMSVPQQDAPQVQSPAGILMQAGQLQASIIQQTWKDTIAAASQAFDVLKTQSETYGVQAQTAATDAERRYLNAQTEQINSLLGSQLTKLNVDIARQRNETELSSLEISKAKFDINMMNLYGEDNARNASGLLEAQMINELKKSGFIDAQTGLMLSNVTLNSAKINEIASVVARNYAETYKLKVEAGTMAQIQQFVVDLAKWKADSGKYQAQILCNDWYVSDATMHDIIDKVRAGTELAETELEYLKKYGDAEHTLNIIKTGSSIIADLSKAGANFVPFAKFLKGK